MSAIKYSEFEKLNPRLVKRGDAYNKWNDRYECPWCVDEKHKKKAKFYYSTKNRKGSCWICGVRVYDDRPVDVNQLCQESLERDEAPEYALTHWDLSKWTYPIRKTPGDAYYEYLTGKRKLKDSVLDKYNVRYCNVPYPGIILPNSQDAARTDFFQVRNIGSGAKLRYTNCSTLKPVYSAGLEIKAEALIAEGCFSTISTDSSGYSSLALYGKYGTDFQMKQLDESRMELPTVCLDGGELLPTIVLMEQLLGIRDSVGVVCLPMGEDPNDCISSWPKFYGNRFVVSRDGLNYVKQKLDMKSLKYNEACAPKQWASFYQVLQDLKRIVVSISSV